jgi:hypothetical protein
MYLNIKLNLAYAVFLIISPMDWLPFALARQVEATRIEITTTGGMKSSNWIPLFCCLAPYAKISRTEVIVGKQKHLQVTLSYHLQSMILQIVRSDSSNPSTFQCMCGRPVLEWPVAAMSYSVVSPQYIEIISP